MTTTTETLTGRAAAEWLAEALTAKFAGEGPFSMREFSVTPGGRKFHRVAQGQPGRGAESVHCFVEDATGAVYKAEGWKKPAQGARYGTVQAAAEAADVYGSYLYAR